MAIEKATGIIIRLMDYSETSQIATFLTDNAGKVGLIAKGAKRAKSSTGGAMDMLTVNEIVYSPSGSGGLGNLREAHVLEQFAAAQVSPAHYYAALYFAELSDVFAEGVEDSREHYELLLSSLRALSTADAETVGNLLLYFESHILMISGLAPNLGQCVNCGNPPQTEGDVRISLADGGILCRTCQGGVKISPATLAALRRVCESTIQGVQRLRLRKELAAEVAGVLSALVVYGAHKVPRLLRYVRPDFEKSWNRWALGAAVRK